VRTGRSAGWIVRSGAIAASVVVAAAALAAAVVQSSTGAATTSAAVKVDDFDCGSNWSAPRSGQRQITVVNAGSSVVDVELLGASTSLTYGEIEAMAPGVTRTMIAVIPPGRYRLGCVYSENATIYSPTETVSGPPVLDAHPYMQVTYSQMAPLVESYRAAVTAGLSTLATDTDRLRALADAGQLAQAEQAWLVAHLDYARLGAAYGTFGDFNDEIDGRPNGLPQGVDDPGWTGFLRLEYALWHDQPPAAVAAVADQLDTYVHQLVAAFPEQTTMPNDLSLRTHEILENTLQFELTGETDQGSHTGLATAEANVQGTEMTLAAIAPLLRRNAPAVFAASTAALHYLGDLLSTYQLPDGWWTPVQSLTQTQREVLDGAIGEYLETVSPVPDILELSPEASSP
jgi:high-affinity iron transporter